jgi:hypothetical protein
MKQMYILELYYKQEDIIFIQEALLQQNLAEPNLCITSHHYTL